ncbi:hypothetical protein BX600DRAFT_514345 [Xylariales sp. PMI_506]|nr:hypothetical protein BX600DRAFT_514345 [Xylariales sp. PMI_506]
MSRSIELTPEELMTVAQTISELLRDNVKFAVIGGAACSLLRVVNGSDYRATKDFDLVIAPTKSFNAEILSNWLVKKHPGRVRSVANFGVITPAIPIYREQVEYLVEVEIFDIEAWPNRQQYNLEDTTSNPITTVPLPQASSKSTRVATIPVMHPTWLLREKILSQYERQGSLKERSDISDIQALLGIIRQQALVLSTEKHITALKNLMAKRPDLVILLLLIA